MPVSVPLPQAGADVLCCLGLGLVLAAGYDGCRFVGNSRNRYGNRRRIVWTGSCGNPAYVGESGASDPII